MKKTIKIFLLTIFSLILLSLFPKVEANSINSISMDIAIDDNGNASVTEIWKCKTSQGTEVYHPYYNLGNSEISNLTVSENGTKYTTLSTWNTSGTLSDKAYKCGINRLSNGVELCWGISNYSSHTYTIKYNISNFVSELSDSQMIYWTLIPYDFSNSIGNVYIKIHSNFNIPDSVGVWGYGNYGGTAYVYDGYIEMQSDGNLATDEYMTILVQFPLESFNCNNKLDYNFAHYLNMAEDGAEHYVDNSSYSSSNDSSFFDIVLGLFSFIISVLPFTIIIILIAVKSNPESLDFGENGKKMPLDLDYYRDIPCNGNLFRAYYIAYNYGLLKNKTDILGAIILKWLKDSLIKLEQKEQGVIFKKENTVIILNGAKTELITNVKEKEIFDLLYRASGDGILENKEFERWCRNNYSKILNWFENILKEEKQDLVINGFLIPHEKTTLKIFKSTVFTVTPEIRNEAIQIAGLKKYLIDYTLIHEREAIEVSLFEDYLIFAQMLGIAKTVAKQFKELYPDLIEQSHFTSYDNFYYIALCSNNGISAANTAKIRAESYSSGGGGFSSGGGGGGSFGGGGGGGGFR